MKAKSKTTSIRIYRDDLPLVEAVRSKNGLRYNADAVRAVLRGKAGKK